MAAEKNDATGAPVNSILVVAGGTGGHIFPALVFGRWLERHRGASVTWLSGSRPIEATIYASAGVTPRRLSLEGSPLGVRSPGRVLKRSLSLFSAFGETSRCLAESRPRAAFLFGSYVSLAPLLLCRLRKIPVVVHEQNAVAGRVTRLAARLGARIAAGWPECLGVKNFTTVGIPTREPTRLPRAEALSRLCPGLSGDRLGGSTKIVGVAMGSLGSRPLAEKIIEAAGELAGRKVALVLLGDAPDGMEAPENVLFVGRRWDMDPFYSLCDVLVCRAGGATLAEALRWGLPTVTVPWAGAAEGHQERNARCFAAMGDGVVWHEGITVSLAAAIEDQLNRERAAVFSNDDPCEALAKIAGL